MRMSDVVSRTNIRIGIPRILGMFEVFPFWRTLVANCGFEVVLSDVSNQALYEKGVGSVMSDNICFPAKLAHGHVADLLEKGVDRICYPHVVHDVPEDAAAANSYNCPIVSAYGEVLRASLGLGSGGAPPLDSPVVSFRDDDLLREACRGYVEPLGVSERVFRRAFPDAVAAQQARRSDLLRRGRELLDRPHDRDRPLVVLAGRPYHADPLIEHHASEILSDFGADVVPADVVAGMIEARWGSLGAVSQWAYPNRVLKAAQWVADQEDFCVQLVMISSFGCGPDAFIMDEIRDILTASGKIFTLIKVDEISSTGSVRLRLRSLMETLRWRPVGQEPGSGAPAREMRPRQRSEDGKTFVIPYFADCYTPFISPAFKALGYDLRVLPPPDARSVECGLKYTNNEVCYPAIIIVGDVVKAFESGRCDPGNTVVAMSRTGGQCRASSYTSLIRRALREAGYPEVPVVTIATKQAADEQQAFKLNVRRIFQYALHSIFYADAVARMYHRCVVRERRPGDALAIRERFLKEGADRFERGEPHALLPLLAKAVEAFNGALGDADPRPRVGVVGEIYLKYNAFSQMNIVDWMIAQGVEVSMPMLSDFFLQYFVNARVNRKLYLSRLAPSSLLDWAVEKWIGLWNRKYEGVLERFRLYESPSSIYDKADLASGLVNLVNQYGEGWLIPAEIASLAALHIQNVVCVQPFGCIANHVVAKGIEGAVRQRYPLTNLLFLDFDPGTSEVNVLNRLHFMIDYASCGLGEHLRGAPFPAH